MLPASIGLLEQGRHGLLSSVFRRGRSPSYRQLYYFAQVSARSRPQPHHSSSNAVGLASWAC